MLKVEKLGPVIRPADTGARTAKFNPGVYPLGNMVHMLYRFCVKKKEWAGKKIDWGEVRGSPYEENCIRHALLSAAGRLVEDDGRKVIVPEFPEESEGCEDARIVEFESKIYVFYTAWNSRKTVVGVAKTEDFEKFTKLGFIANVESDKDAFIFPERIDGRIAYVHRVEPAIRIDYFDSIEEMLEPRSWPSHGGRLKNRIAFQGAQEWERTKIGGGAPPIRTDRGWLFIYHGVDLKGHYHAGALLADLKDPFIIKARLSTPLFSPKESYELQGDYEGCVFPMGAYRHQEWLYISYGSADTFSAMARVKYGELLDELSSGTGSTAVKIHK